MNWLIIKLFVVLELFWLVMAQNEPGPSPPNPFSFKPKFNPSMAIIMIVLVTAFFLLGFFSVYIRQCTVTRFGGTGGFNLSPDGGDGGRLRVARGLDTAVLETFPTFVYSSVKGLKIGKDVLECAVCLNEFEDDETLRLIPMCNHAFHTDCIDTWLCSHDTCPVCRANLVPDPDEILGSTILSDQEPEINERGPNELPAVVFARSPETSLLTSSKSHPHRTRSTGFRFTGLFPRSHTTGHSIVQVGEYDRFTLILPEEVRNHILNRAVLNRARSCVEFPRARSTKRGFRSKSSGGKNNFFYERFNHEHRSSRPGFSASPKLSRLGSVKSANANGTRDEVERLEMQKSLLRSMKSPFDRLFLGTDKEYNIGKNVGDGERSSDRLRPDSEV